MSRGLVSHRTAGTRQFMIDLAGHAHPDDIRQQAPPSYASVAASLNGKTVGNADIAATK